MTTISVFPKDPQWDGESTSRIPFWAYTREDLYKKELDHFFYNKHWCYVGLEAEIPNAGDFRRTVVGRAYGQNVAQPRCWKNLV
jgi:salicylate 5-hydroxylase large subunit